MVFHRSVFHDESSTLSKMQQHSKGRQGQHRLVMENLEQSRIEEPRTGKYLPCYPRELYQNAPETS